MKKIVVVLLSMVLAGCVSNIAKDFGKPFEVRFEAKPSQGEVKVLTKAQGYKARGRRYGYVGYAPGESGLTFFAVKNKRKALTCEGGADWVITHVQLTTEGDPDEQKGTGFGSEPPDWLPLAFPEVDPDNGDLFGPVDASDGTAYLPVNNANAQEGFQMIYYQVTLSPCDDAGGTLSPISTDPAWGNGGKR